MVNLNIFISITSPECSPSWILSPTSKAEVSYKEDIETRDGYPALSFQGYLSDVERNDLAYSESISKKILWLPSSNNLSEEEVSKISKIISNYK